MFENHINCNNSYQIDSVQILFDRTASFGEILTVRPLLDQMKITFSFIWILLNFYRIF